MSYTKLPIVDGNKFETIFYFDFEMDEEKLRESIEKIFSNPDCGYIHRIKGLVKREDGSFYEFNANRKNITVKAALAERSVLIVIGERINKAILSEYLGEPTL